MIKRLILMLLGVGIVLGLVFGFGAFRSIMIGKYLAGAGDQVQTVATVKAPLSAWQPTLQSVGSIVAINGANLSAEVAGIVDTINFESGEDVAAGALLLTLRPNNDNAVLAQLQAAAALDEVNYRRDVKQLAADGVAQATVDTDRATLQGASAQVQAQQALMAEKQVRAPFAGRLGIRAVDLGQFLSAGTAIVTLQQLDPLFVDFYLPQAALSQIAVGQAVSVSVDGFANRSFPGKITAIGSQVDAATRTIQVRATLANTGLTLRPGMFATVAIANGAPQNLVTLPQSAITYNAYGDTVYVVSHGRDAAGKETLTAGQVFVTLGDTRGDQVAVLKGVKPGDEVVTAGQLKLKNGTPVAIDNSIEPSNDPNPSPLDE